LAGEAPAWAGADGACAASDATAATAASATAATENLFFIIHLDRNPIPPSGRHGASHEASA
jgi:hypothetical protein